MPRREYGKTHIRKLTRTGGGKSYAMTLPIEFIRELGWRDGQKVVVTKKDNQLVIEDWSAKSE